GRGRRRAGNPARPWWPRATGRRRRGRRAAPPPPAPMPGAPRGRGCGPSRPTPSSRRGWLRSADDDLGPRLDPPVAVLADRRRVDVVRLLGDRGVLGPLLRQLDPLQDR